MTTHTGKNTRTITGYVTQLLEYPRWVIERDVDFTHCQYDGRFDKRITDCATCRFGEACNWLNQGRTPTIDAGTVDELVAALQTAVQYFQAKPRHDGTCDCDECCWLREARQFLHTRSHWT